MNRLYIQGNFEETISRKRLRIVFLEHEGASAPHRSHIIYEIIKIFMNYGKHNLPIDLLIFMDRNIPKPYRFFQSSDKTFSNKSFSC